MQSGIAASAELRDAFNSFTSEPSLFALPITISSESLQPQSPIPFQGDFSSSLAQLSPHLQPKVPIYLILRQSQGAATGNLVAVTYVPSTAPVRSKTLFASTRTTLVRDLGLEKFADTLFVTDAEEVLEPQQWEDRAASKHATTDAALLSTEERELQSVKRAEEEARHGTAGRDLMGEGGSGTSWGSHSRSTAGAGATGGGIRMKATDDASAAFDALSDSATRTEGAHLVQYGINLSTETLELLVSATDVTVSDVPRRLPADRPSYTFYHYPGTSSVIFIYTCPGTSKVKERMMYAASRNGVIELAKDKGVKIAKRLEAGEPEDITEQRLKDEVGGQDGGGDPTTAASSRQGFARPKRPGRR